MVEGMADADIAKTLAHNFSHERRARGITLQEVADQLGVSKAWICQIETGYSTPNLRRLDELARAIGMDVRSLLRPIGSEGDIV
jgi:transcriptional regulator with XRE-family HTH domain